MGKGKKAAKRAAKQTAGSGAAVRKLPKVECCVSKKKCDRCPLRMLKEGTLPEGLTVKKRRLVRVDGTMVTKEKLAEVA